MLKEKIWWQFVRQHRQRVLFIIVLGLLTSYLTLLLPLSIGKYMEIVFSAGSGKTKALQLLGINLPDNLNIFFTFFFGLILLKFFISWVHQYFCALAGESFTACIRQQVFNLHLLQKAKGNMHAGLLLAYSSEAKALQQLLVKGVIGLAKDILFLGMALYILFSLDARLTFVVIAAILIFWFIQRWYNRKQKAIFSDKRKKQGSLLNFISRALLQHSKTKNNYLQTFEKKSEKFRLTLTSYYIKKTMLKALAPLMLYCMLALVMVLMVWGTSHKLLQAGDVIAYILLLMTLFPALRNIIKIEHVWLQGELSARKFYKTKEDAEQISCITSESKETVPLNPYSAQG